MDCDWSHGNGRDFCRWIWQDISSEISDLKHPIERWNIHKRHTAVSTGFGRGPRKCDPLRPNKEMSSITLNIYESLINVKTKQYH